MSANISKVEFEQGLLKTLLIVDDDLEILDDTCNHLSEYGFSVLKASNGKKALEICESVRVNMVLSDLFMPIMDGITLFQELKKVNPQLPVVLMSVASLPEWFRVKHPTCNFIEKNYDTSKLAAQLMKLMNGSVGSRNFTDLQVS